MLSRAQIHFQREVPLPVRYKDVLLDCGYRIDLVVGGDLIVDSDWLVDELQL
jgi:GxxExxY protein